MKKFIKNNIKVVIAFICGLILAGGTATVIAVSIASSNVTYSENSQSTVEGALNDLYQKADILNKIPTFYQYWTANYNNSTYSPSNVPNSKKAHYYDFVSGTGPNVFTRTTYSGGKPIGHEACLYYNSKVFCLANGYWSANGSSSTNVKDALKSAMESALGETTTSCDSNSSVTHCYFNSVRCYAFSDGDSGCSDGSKACYVYSNGRASCY